VASVARDSTRTLRRAVTLAGVAALTALLVAAPAQARTYTLDEAIEVALAHNVSLAKAEEGLHGARAGVLSGWSGMLPRISGSVSRSDWFYKVPGTPDTEGESYRASLGLSQTLLSGSALANIAGAHRNRTAQELSLHSTERDVVFQVKQGYYGLLKAERLRDVQAEAMELAEEQLRKTESLFDLGSASRSDLLKAQVQVGQSELALISADRAAETARASLCYLLGIDVTGDLEVVDPPEERAEAEVLEFDVGEAIARRPDVQAWEHYVVAARRSLLSSKAGRWPELSMSVGYDKDGDELGDVFEDVGDEYDRTVSLSLSVPIFNGLATKASIDNSKSSLRTAELSLRDAKLQAAFEIETARLYVVEQARSVAVAEQSVAQAEEDLRVSEERFRLRAASMLELIDARVAYSRARADLVEARYDYEIAKAELKLALGL
jgi:outer membrane protein TolC